MLKPGLFGLGRNPASATGPAALLPGLFTVMPVVALGVGCATGAGRTGLLACNIVCDFGLLDDTGFAGITLLPAPVGGVACRVDFGFRGATLKGGIFAPLGVDFPMM